MKFIPCSNSDSGALQASQWLEDAIAKTGASRIFIPAGSTPLALYQLWEQNLPAYLLNKTFVQVDDIATGQQKDIFRTFFLTHLNSFKDNFSWIDQDNTGADIAILGLGTNGHVAFHEPGLSTEFQFGCVALSRDTCQRLGADDGTWGITYGIGAFMRCQQILLLVYGENKRIALTETLNKNPDFPASALMNHPNLTIFSDLTIAESLLRQE